MQSIETPRSPQSPRTPRRDGWTLARRAQFLEHLAAGLDVKRACARLGLSREGAYRLRRRDAAFARAWDAALAERRAAETRAFLARLPEALRRTVSDLSTACELPRAQAAQGVSAEDEPELSARTVSGVSAACELGPV